MLVLSRREDEALVIGDSIVVTVLRVAGDKVRLGIQAPADVTILRNELAASRQDETPPILKMPSVGLVGPASQPC
ncbi:MAG TPA: carbon storage regulator [Pirellulales bacterium]|nr:carbon storage regulator [Pirellulales bacterium]